MNTRRLFDKDVQLGIAGVLVTGYVCYKVYHRKTYNLPPGPKPLPIVGNLLSIGMSKLHLKFTKMKEEYGPVFTVYLGSQATIVLNDVPSTREAYLQKGDDYADRPKSFVASLFTDGGKDIAMGQFGPVWKFQRKIAHGALKKYATGKNLEERIHKAFESITSGLDIGKPVDAMTINIDFTYDILLGMCFGTGWGKDSDFVVKMKKLTVQLDDTALVDFLPLLQYKIFESKSLKKLKSEVAMIIDFLETQIQEHMKTYDPDDISDLTYDLIHLAKKAELEEGDTVLSQLTNQHYRQIISDMFFAGTDTTRCTLTYFFAYMVNYPEVQEKAHEEIKDFVGLDGYISLKTKDNLPYTLACLFESMRIMPVVPLGLPHMTRCDTTLGKYTIPKETQTMMNVWGIHHDPEYFPDPFQFKPERWLDVDGKFQYHPYSFVPFSMGRRVCVGESLAKAEIPMFVALFLQKFKFERVSEELVEIEGRESFGLLEPLPFQIILKHRK